MAELKQGTKVTNTRNGNEFLVKGFWEGKYTLEDVTTGDTKSVAEGTIKRWYKVAKEPVTEEVEVPKPTPVAGPKVRKVRTVKRPTVVKHTIEEEDSVEEVGIKEVTTKRKGTPKSDHVLSITKELEKRISEAYPSSRRGVTTQFIKYSHKYNFVKIFQGKTRLRINVLTRGMDPETKKKLDRIVPASYGWPIDGFFNINKMEDLDTAMELIHFSHAAAKQG